MAITIKRILGEKVCKTFVLFQSINEVIITTKELEQDSIEEYFVDGGRNLNDYKRIESNNNAILLMMLAS